MVKKKQPNFESVVYVNSRAEGRGTAPDGRKFAVAPENLGTALNGDFVTLIWTSKANARVIKIIKRAQTEFVGILTEDGPSPGRASGRFFVAPDDRRFYPTSLKLRGAQRPDLKIGYRVLARLEEWTDPKKEPLGRILEVIGPAGDHETEMRSAALAHGFDEHYPPAAKREALKIATGYQQKIAAAAFKRRDFRPITTFTIDPIDAKDFDDALSFRILPGGRYEVGIHIADVSHYVRPNTPLDTEAARRGTSVYLADRTIPMLPEELSNGISSLVAGKDRLTMSAVFELDKEANIKKQWFGRTIINSNKRFTYEEAQEILDGQLDSPFSSELVALNRLAYALRKKKIEAGAVNFEDTEVRVILDENNRPIAFRTTERTDSHKLIEDFMLLANKRVAEYVSRINRGQPGTFVYRIHDAPDREKIVDLAEFLRPLGYKLEVGGKNIGSRELNRLLKQSLATPEEAIVQRAAIRAMSRAIYSVYNIGHFGLAFQHYTHFTSPIRRYPDLMVHRLLQIYLSGAQPKAEMLKRYAELAIHCSTREAAAAEAERESVKFKQTEYMREYIGETFTGIISGVTDFGVFIEERTTHAEGLIRMRDLGDDYFILDPKKYCLVGSRTKLKYSLGDIVKVIVTAADPISRTIDFKLA